MSELGSSSDMPFEIRAVHDVGYPGGDNENAPFGRLPGANCAQSSGVTQVFCLPISPPSEKKKVAGSFSGVLSSWKLPLKYEVVHDALFPPYNGLGIIRTISSELGPPKKQVELRTTTKK